jgi:Bacteriophage HK97-gp10, putative tail-component
MADGLEITMDLTKFNAMMTELAGPTAESAARRAMRAGGRVIQAAITEAAPERPDLPSGTALPPGALKSDIELHVSKEQDGSISAYVEPGRLTMHAARWTEYGHEMVTHGKQVGKFVQVAKFVPAHPFIRPAFDLSEAAALAAVEETIADEINKAAAQGAR